MPLPPPPATALRRTGKPIDCARAWASSGFSMGSLSAGNGGNVGAARELAAGGFGAERFHGLRGGADEGDACVGAGARESGVFGEEAVAGMDGVGAGFFARRR